MTQEEIAECLRDAESAYHKAVVGTRVRKLRREQDGCVSIVLYADVNLDVLDGYIARLQAAMVGKE